MRFREFQHVARKFYRGNLHPQAQAEVRHIVFAREPGRLNFSFDPPFAKATRDQYPAKPIQVFLRAIAFDVLRIDFLDFHPAIVGDAPVNGRLIHRFISVLHLDVFADHSDAHPMLGRDQFANNLLPMRHVGRRRIQS